MNATPSRRNAAPSRRTVFALALALPMLGGALLPLSAHAQSNKVSIGLVAKDGSGVLPTLLANDPALQRKHNIDFSVKNYPSVTAVWTAFAAGEFDVLIGGPAGFVGLAERGVPIHYMSTYAISNAQIFGKGKKIESADDLRGKRVTAVTAVLWKLTEAQIKEKFGLAPGAGYQLIPVPNVSSGVSQVLAGTADYAMGWEPDASRVRVSFPDVKVVLSSEDLRPAGEPTHIQILTAKNSLPADVEPRTAAALNEAAAKVSADPAAAESEFVRLTGAERSGFTDAVKFGRYKLSIHALTEAEKNLIRSDIQKTLPPNGAIPASLFAR